VISFNSNQISFCLQTQQNENYNSLNSIFFLEGSNFQNSFLLTFTKFPFDLNSNSFKVFFSHFHFSFVWFFWTTFAATENNPELGKQLEVWMRTRCNFSKWSTIPMQIRRLSKSSLMTRLQILARAFSCSTLSVLQSLNSSTFAFVFHTSKPFQFHVGWFLL